MSKTFQITDDVHIGENKLVLIGGPCSIENADMAFKVAETVKDICDRLHITYIFKGSFDKANRSSLKAGRAVGIEAGLRILSDIRTTLNIPVTTDVHESQQCEEVGKIVDILQIPAYLCRQTDLLLAASKTGKTVSVKKGQFMAPWNMNNCIEKIESCGNDRIILMERGSSFGYNRLVVDITGIPFLQSFGYPVFIDATHSVQEPGGLGTFTKGNRDNAALIMYAALSAGADGVFAEIHPDPDNATSDVGSQIKLSEAERVLLNATKFYEIANGCQL